MSRRRAADAAGTNAFAVLDAEAILAAAESSGGRSTGRVVQLNSMENRVHAVEMEDGATVVVKFYRPGRWTREQLLGEHALALVLQVDGIPTPRYRPVLDASLAVLQDVENQKALLEAEGLLAFP